MLTKGWVDEFCNPGGRLLYPLDENCLHYHKIMIKFSNTKHWVHYVKTIFREKEIL